MVFLGEEHAGEDEGGAEDEVEGDLLIENGPGEDNGDYGIEIDVVGADNGAKFCLVEIKVEPQMDATRSATI